MKCMRVFPVVDNCKVGVCVFRKQFTAIFTLSLLIMSNPGNSEIFANEEYLALSNNPSTADTRLTELDSAASTAASSDDPVEQSTQAVVLANRSEARGKLDVKVTGTVTGIPGQELAVFQIEGMEDRILRIDTQLMDGFIIKEITERTVVLRHQSNGEFLVLNVKR